MEKLVFVDYENGKSQIVYSFLIVFEERTVLLVKEEFD